jgi:hypothetical protein
LKLRFITQPNGETCQHVHVFHENKQVCVMVQEDFDPDAVRTVREDVIHRLANIPRAPGAQIQVQIHSACKADPGIKKEQLLAYLESLEFSE